MEVIDRADHSKMEREKWWIAGSEASQTETNISRGSVWKTDEAETRGWKDGGRSCWLFRSDGAGGAVVFHLSRRIQLGGEPPPVRDTHQER